MTDLAAAITNLDGTRTSQQRNLDAYETALRVKREADDRLRKIDDQLDDVRAEASWELEARFVTEGNKTYRVDGDRKVAMVAEDRKRWIAAQVDKTATVKPVLHAYHQAEEAAAAARDAVIVAERRVAAAKYDLAAATQILATQTAAAQLH